MNSKTCPNLKLLCSVKLQQNEATTGRWSDAAFDLQRKCIHLTETGFYLSSEHKQYYTYIICICSTVYWMLKRQPFEF